MAENPKCFDYLIIGAGLTGSTMARQLAEQNGKILIVDRRDHIAGNCHDRRNENSILYHLYGPHIFHTNNEHVVSFLSQFTDWYDYEHRTMGLIDGRYVPIPFNLTSIQICFEPSQAERLSQLLVDKYGYGAKIPILQLKQTHHQELQELAHYIYDKVFLGYTKKQWGVSPEELDPSVSNRVPVVVSYDDRYFQDSFQKMPKHGYTEMVSNILDHPNITVELNTDFSSIRSNITYGQLIYTGTIDGYFHEKLGRLPHRSLDLVFQEYTQPMHQPVAQINYPNDHDFTRITEMPHLTREFSEKTLVGIEYSQPYMPEKNEPYYPVPHPDNAELYLQYQALAATDAPEVIFIGRLGEYKYYNMDQSVAQALEVAKQIMDRR